MFKYMQCLCIYAYIAYIFATLLVPHLSAPHRCVQETAELLKSCENHPWLTGLQATLTQLHGRAQAVVTPRGPSDPWVMGLPWAEP